MRVPGKRGPRSGPDGATREALLEAAFKEFTYHGFDRATTRQIAKAANVDPAMVNYRFGSKEDLWLAVLEDIKTQSSPYIREARELIQDPDPERSIKALMQVILRVGVEKPMIIHDDFQRIHDPESGYHPPHDRAPVCGIRGTGGAARDALRLLPGRGSDSRALYADRRCLSGGVELRRGQPRAESESRAPARQPHKPAS